MDTINEHAGSCLGYDNIYHYKTRGGGPLDITHPVFNIFHFIKYIISIPFTWLFNAKGAIIFFVLLTNSLVSLTLLVLYKYLKEITSLPTFRCLMLTLFCGLFFTTIILSFTMETYTFSFLFLMLSIHIISLGYKKTNQFDTYHILFFEFLCGGITITNAAKPLSVLLLNKKSFKNKLIKVIKVATPFAIFIVAIFLFYLVINLRTSNQSGNSLISAIIVLKDYFHFDDDFLKNIFIDYWGSSILVAELSPLTVYTETVLRPDNYSYCWQYILSLSLLIIFIISLFLNRKNTLVKLILLYILVDIVIHFGFRYGINEAIIFGGHWLFLVPISLGWLYKLASHKKVLSIIFDAYIIIFIVALIYNNIKEIYTSFFI